MSQAPLSPQSTGLAPNVAGALAYLLGPLTGIFFLVIEKENRFVRFHAAQSIVVGIACIVAGITLSVISAILGLVPIIGWLVSILLSLGMGLGFFILWLTLMFMAFQGREWEVPGVGAQARRLFLPAPQ
jgi:uncharacterized membrane protein